MRRLYDEFRPVVWLKFRAKNALYLQRDTLALSTYGVAPSDFGEKNSDTTFRESIP